MRIGLGGELASTAAALATAAVLFPFMRKVVVENPDRRRTHTPIVRRTAGNTRTGGRRRLGQNSHGSACGHRLAPAASAARTSRTTAR